MTLPDKLGDSELIIISGTLAILVAAGLVWAGKMDGMALAAVAGAFFGGSAIAAFRN